MLIINGQFPDYSTEIALIHAELDAGGDFGYLNLTTPSDTTLTTENQYYAVGGTFSTDGTNLNFTSVADGTIVYDGLKTIRCTMVGTSDIKVNKASQITYGLFNKGVLIPGAFTPHDFPAAAKSNTISITTSFLVHVGDIFQVYAKSDTATTVLTANNLNVVISEI